MEEPQPHHGHYTMKNIRQCTEPTKEGRRCEFNAMIGDLCMCHFCKKKGISGRKRRNRDEIKENRPVFFL